ncbi:helix-turn-helix domain-containing protein [Piscirickettsia salmonis]|uniref:helix-turn-helix domain-containing protein n=1 Tax=Piscirickettsia salmonis TaxID=1238 RepID=UPI001E3623B9|nr:helix-turn-helix domain-containing protein [Piscirickettsia salmonis]QGO39551.1 hypothetical protein Psal040_03324 [Piscirickettsia salmonis]
MVYRHLNEKDRFYIEQRLSEGDSLRSIARALGFSPRALLRNLWSHIPGTIQLRLKLSGMPRLVILFKIPAPISPSFF